MSFSLPTTNDLQDEALAVAEGAAKAAFGTRFKRVPRALFAKLSLPVLSVLAVFAFVFCVAAEATRAMERSMERSGGGHGGQSVFPLSFWSLKTHEYALTATTSLALGMYLCCVYRDPGRVPAGYAPDPESAAARGALVELKRKGGSRFCKKCARAKPPARAPLPPVQPLRFTHGPPLRLGEQLRRAQELQVFLSVSVLRRRLDLARRFVISVARVRGGARIVDERDPRSGVAIPRREDVSLGVAEVAALTLAVPLALALTMLFAWHCYLVSRNKTTIEHYEGVRAAAGAEAAAALPPLHATDGEPRHPYSLGLRANLRRFWARASCAGSRPGAPSRETAWRSPMSPSTASGSARARARRRS